MERQRIIPSAQVKATSIGCYIDADLLATVLQRFMLAIGLCFSEIEAAGRFIHMTGLISLAMVAMLRLAKADEQYDATEHFRAFRELLSQSDVTVHGCQMPMTRDICEEVVASLVTGENVKPFPPTFVAASRSDTRFISRFGKCLDTKQGDPLFERDPFRVVIDDRLIWQPIGPFEVFELPFKTRNKSSIVFARGYQGIYAEPETRYPGAAIFLVQANGCTPLLIGTNELGSTTRPLNIALSEGIVQRKGAIIVYAARQMLEGINSPIDGQAFLLQLERQTNKIIHPRTTFWTTSK